VKNSFRKLTLLAVSLLTTGGALGATPPAQLYAQKCAACHGKDLKGNPAMAKMFKVEPRAMDLVSKETLAKKDAELIEITTKGKNKMPAQEGKLTADDIAGLIAYIRTQAAPEEKTK